MLNRWFSDKISYKKKVKCYVQFQVRDFFSSSMYLYNNLLEILCYTYKILVEIITTNDSYIVNNYLNKKVSPCWVPGLLG